MARTKAQDVMVLALGAHRTQLIQRIEEIQQTGLPGLLDELAEVETQLQEIDATIPPASVSSTSVVTATELVASRTRIGSSSNNNHLLATSTDPNTAARFHFEPNGRFPGTASKTDWMLDPYNLDPTNYRHAGIYGKSFDPADLATLQGDNGIIVIGGKAVGDQHGIFPAIHFAFSDDGIGAAVPGKLHYFDTSDTVWRTPMKGAWRAGLDVTVGDFNLAGSKLYQAENSGITGPTKPTHLSGSASDGVVSWLFIRNFAAAAASIKGCWIFGDRDSMPKFGWPNVRDQHAKDSLYWNGVRLQYADAAGALAWFVYSPAGTDDLRIESSDGQFIRLSKTGKYIQTSGLAKAIATPTLIVSGDATPSIAGTEMLQAVGATPITAFTGGIPNQSFVFKGNGSVTLVNSANIVLNTGANKTPGNGKILRFWTNGAGTAATEEG